MATAFCEEADVASAMQEDSNFPGSPSSSEVKDAIHSASDWFARSTNGHWFDSGGGTTLVDTSAASASDVVLDVPASPHRQGRQIVSSVISVRYPVTRAGNYARVLLPHPYVTSLTKMEVRDNDGGVTDWVADSSFTSGRGEDYYLQSRGQDSYGRTFLYLDAGAIGAREDFTGLLTLAYDYGLDYQTTPWDDVKRGIAQLAAADVAIDDDVRSAIPDNGQLIPLDTLSDRYETAAMRNLNQYISAVSSG